MANVIPAEITNQYNPIPREINFGRGALNPIGLFSQATKLELDTSIAGNALLGRTMGGALTVESGEERILRGITLGANFHCRFVLTINDDDLITGSARLLATKYIFAGGTGGTTYVPLNWVLKCNQYLTVRVNQYTGLVADADILHVSSEYDSFAKTLYNNKNVKRVMHVKGDSITFGTGPTHTANMYQVLMWNHLRLKGCSLGIDLQGYPGFQTNHVKNFVRSGYFDYDRDRLSCWAFGTNDAIQNIGDAVFKANMKEFVLRDLYNAEDKKMPVIMFSPIPIANSTNEARAELIRTPCAEILAEIILSEPVDVSSRLFHINLALGVTGLVAFDRTVSANYIDTAGSGVHPSDLATPQIQSNIIVPYFESVEGLRLIELLK